MVQKLSTRNENGQWLYKSHLDTKSEDATPNIAMTVHQLHVSKYMYACLMS